MTRFLKRCSCVLLFAAGVYSASAFSFWGTKEGYQADNLGYLRLTEIRYPGTIWVNLLTPEFTFAPHNLGEEYRWNTPVLFYAYDKSFLDYFGSNGVYAVDSAFAILNALTNVSAYSSDLSELPLDEARLNYTAQALHLFDLKSAALEMLVTRLGLADPERWTWTIRHRNPIPPAPCPVYNYTIIQRNFDPVTLEPTKYVNGNLFTYAMLQHCPPDIDWVDAEEFLFDPLEAYKTTVASSKITFPTVLYYGMYHSGLTRDDVGGLRYLYRTNNFNVESAGTTTVLSATNLNVQQLLVTSNLTLFAAQALTNDAATLAALYPGLIITSSTPIFTNLVTTNVFAFFENSPYAPFGSPATLVVSSNFTTNVVIWFNHTFANVVTNTYYTNGTITILETNIAPCLYVPPGNLCTNVTVRTLQVPMIMGDFFIIPPTNCGFSIISTQLVRALTATNVIAVATNVPGTTNVNGQEFSQSIVTYFTNSIFIVHPVDCVTNSVALRQGIERIRFVRRDYESLLGQFWPSTNTSYTLTAVVSNRNVSQFLQRFVTQPDILIRATDLVTGPPVDTVDHFGVIPTLNSSNAIAGLAGPGTFEGPMNLTFNKVGPIRLNTSPAFVNEGNSIFYFTWGSFDGSTNAPIIYPEGTSITDLENQVLIQVSPGSLPPGAVGTSFSASLSVIGGQSPYNWSLVPGSPALPPGLTLTQNPADSSRATLSGTPTAAGVFDFWIRLTDAGSRFVDTFYVLSINP